MAYAYVSSGENSANSATITYSPTAGNLVIWLSKTSIGGGTPTVTGVVDNLGNPLAQGIATYNATSGPWLTAFYLSNCASGITSFTATFNGGTPSSTNIAVAEYSGIATSSPLVVAGHAEQTTPGTGTDAVTSGNFNVTSQPALVFGHQCLTNGNSTTTDTPGTGFTQRRNTNNFWQLEDKRVTATGNTAVTGTTSNATFSFSSQMLAFAEFTNTAYTLTAEQGSYALNGQAAALKHGKTLVAGYGTYSLVGSEAQIDLSLVAAAGSFALNGQSAGLRQARFMPAGFGTYNLTGQNVALIANIASAGGKVGSLIGAGVLSFAP